MVSATRPYRNIAGDHLTQNLHHAQGQHPLGNRDGTTVRIAVQSLAMQLLAQPAFGGAAFASINLFRPSLSMSNSENIGGELHSK
ncbi:hypothetical protein [Paracoccus sp. (in: a-proteobacteria)]